MKIQNKAITWRKPFSSQKARALLLFLEGVNVGVFKKPEEGLAIRDQGTIRVRWIRQRIEALWEWDESTTIVLVILLFYF